MTTPINGTVPAPKQIRFVHNQGHPPSKRRRINAACLTCRRRKTRCAGEKPDCSTCKKHGHVCLGYTDVVERKREDDQDDEVVHKTESPETANLVNGFRDHYLEGDERQLDSRRWNSNHAPPMAGFVDHDAVSRSDSASSATLTSGRARDSGNDWDQDNRSPSSAKPVRRSNNTVQDRPYSDDSRSPSNRSPDQLERTRVPYFRYFGPTAIVPGFKQMVANVYHRDSRRKSRGSSFSTASPGTLFGYGIPRSRTPHQEFALETLEDLPVYDVNSPGPVHPLIISLVETFFVHLGANYLFLKRDRFLRMLKDKRVEPILVDAMCALAARFSDQPIFANDHDGKMKRSEYGHVFAQRAKAATVDTFPCPSVAAIQACLMMAYEGFGADQDSALWMYLGIAIRMAVDLGLQKKDGVKYHHYPWYTKYWSRKSNDNSDGPEGKHDVDDDDDEEQREAEEERINTFWAVFVLDRAISSGTGRPVTFRDDDFELSLPPPTIDPASGRPAPFPPFIEIIHLYGRVSDLLNNIKSPSEITDETRATFSQMETDLTAIYQKQDHRLHFNAVNFREYVSANQGTTFILLHFWFHALVIVLHQPSLLTPFKDLRPTQLLANSREPNSRELSMSSAKTIADILAFAELIDPKSLIGNPFTSQPIYIAACAFLMESVAITSQDPTPEASPFPDARPADSFRPPTGRYGSSQDTRPMRHSLLASAANQNYQRCYKSLQQLEQYWGGVRYILTVLDQKSKGIWDCETFTNEEYEAMKLARRGSLSRLPRFEHPASPNVPPIAYSLTGTTNSPNSNLTVLFQGNPGAQLGAPAAGAVPAPVSAVPTAAPPSVPVSAATPPGNMIYDPIRQSLPETPPAFPPAYLQPNVSAVRYQPHPSRGSQSPAPGKSLLKYESPSPADMDTGSPRGDSKPHMHGGGMSRSIHGSLHQPAYHYPPQQQQHSAYDDRSPSSTPTDSGMGQQQHASYAHGNHVHGHHGNHSHNHADGHHHLGHNHHMPDGGDYNNNNNHSHSHSHHHHNNNHSSSINHHNNNHNHNHNHSHHHHNNNNNHSNNRSNHSSSSNSTATPDSYGEADFAQSGLVSGSYSYTSSNGGGGGGSGGGIGSAGSGFGGLGLGLNPINDVITFNSQEVNFDMLGLQSEIMPPWLDILPGDVLGGLFEGGIVAGVHGGGGGGGDGGGGGGGGGGPVNGNHGGGGGGGGGGG